jgi:hypothetical protein
MQIFLAPRSNETSHKNFLSTIESGVDFSVVEPYLTVEGKEKLGKSGKLFVWGNKETKKASWDKMQIGDLVLFYKGRDGNEKQGKLIHAGRLLFKQHSKDLGLALWPPKTGEEPWTCIFFLSDLQPVYIPIGDVATFAGYNPKDPGSYVVQGFQPLNQQGVDGILAKFGTLEQFLIHYSASGKGGAKMQASFETPSLLMAELQKRTFLTTSQISELEELLSDKKQIIFEGPPGSGKTFVARLFARYFAGLPLTDDPNPQVRIVQFHQSYGYEDFIEGIRPQSNGGQIEYNVLPGIFKRVCTDAAKPEAEGKKFVIIIDEINRGNISRIFGELLLLLEYRNLGIELQYQKEGELFAIPKNVYVIGTMNTTDRSLAQIDYALRRRFYFYRLMPVVDGHSPVLKAWLAAQADFVDAQRDEVLTLFLNLNSRIRRELGEHFQVGHSYLMKPAVRTRAGQQKIWSHAIMPLLEEYFYNRRDREALLSEFAIEKLLTAKTPSVSA